MQNTFKISKTLLKVSPFTMTLIMFAPFSITLFITSHINTSQTHWFTVLCLYFKIGIQSPIFYPSSIHSWCCSHEFARHTLHRFYLCPHQLCALVRQGHQSNLTQLSFGDTCASWSNRAQNENSLAAVLPPTPCLYSCQRSWRLLRVGRRVARIIARSPPAACALLLLG
jgi:hypothetical protein